MVIVIVVIITTLVAKPLERARMMLKGASCELA